MTTDNRISLKLNEGNEWLAKALERERIEQSRPSINNTVQYILALYFNEKKKKS